MTNKIVVYKHIRLDTNEVFYIGIGNPKRPYNKNSRSDFWKRVTNKTDYKVEIIYSDLTWEEACEKEIELIEFYGRRDLGNGTLVNLTDGGEGISGYEMTNEQKYVRMCQKHIDSLDICEELKERNLKILLNSKYRHIYNPNPSIASIVDFNSKEELEIFSRLCYLCLNYITKDEEKEFYKLVSIIRSNHKKRELLKNTI